MAENEVRFQVTADTKTLKKAEEQLNRIEQKARDIEKKKLNQVKAITQKELELNKRKFKKKQISLKQFEAEKLRIITANTKRIEAIQLKSIKRVLRARKAARAQGLQAAPVQQAAPGKPGLGGLTGALGGVAAGAAAAGAAIAVGAKKIVDLGIAAFTTSARLGDLEKRFQVVFGPALDKAKAAATELAAAQGLTNNEFLKAVSLSVDLLKPIGFQAEAATDLALRINNLAAAQKEFNNDSRSAGEIANVLNKALLNERDGLVSLGIKISDLDVKNRVAAKGQAGLTGEAKKQADSLASLELITESSADALKFYAENADSATRVGNILSGSLGEAKESFLAVIGVAIKPFVENLAIGIKAISDVVSILFKTKEGLILLKIAFFPVISLFKILFGIGRFAVTVFRAFADAMKRVFAALKKSGVINRLSNAFKILGNFIRTIVKVVAGPFLRAFNKIKSLFKGGLGLINIQGIIEILIDGILLFIAVIKTAVGTLKPLIRAVLAAGKAVISLNPLEKIKQAKLAAEALIEFGKRSANAIKTATDEFKRLRAEVNKTEAAVKGRTIRPPPPKPKKGGVGIAAEPELTTIERLQVQKDFLDATFDQEQNAILRSANLQAQADLQRQIDFIENNSILTQLEDERNALKLQFAQENANKATKIAANETKKKLKLLDLEIAAEKKKNQEILKVKQRAAALGTKIAENTFEFAEALISAEEGSVLRFLANKIKAIAQAAAKELFIRATVAAATGQFGLAAALGAGAVAVTAAGVGLSSLLNAAADKKKAAAQAAAQRAQAGTEQLSDTGTDSQSQIAATAAATTKAAVTGAGGTVVTNNTVINNNDNRTMIEGNVFDRREFFSEFVEPIQAERATEQGKVVFARQSLSG